MVSYCTPSLPTLARERPPCAKRRATMALFGASTSGSSLTSRTTRGLSCLSTEGRRSRTYSQEQKTRRAAASEAAGRTRGGMAHLRAFARVQDECRAVCVRRECSLRGKVLVMFDVFVAEIGRA